MKEDKTKYIKQIESALELIKDAEVLGSIIKFDIDSDLSRSMAKVYDEWSGHYHGSDITVADMHPQL